MRTQPREIVRRPVGTIITLKNGYVRIFVPLQVVQFGAVFNSFSSSVSLSSTTQTMCIILPSFTCIEALANKALANKALPPSQRAETSSAQYEQHTPT